MKANSPIVLLALLFFLLAHPFTHVVLAEIFEIYPSATESCDEEFESIANKLKPGDELVLHEGIYSQGCRRSLTAQGAPDKPIIIRAASGSRPVLSRSAKSNALENNLDIIDSSYLIIRGLGFRGGSIGVRFIGGNHITLEDCEVFETLSTAIAMNRGNMDSVIIRRNHIHHSGQDRSRPVEGEGLYVGCHDGSCRVSNSLFEGNYIHHLRGTSSGGNDGIEIKFGSHGNIIRDNVIHDTNIGRQYPCIFVYGGGPAPNVVEGNAVWNCGEGIQVVADAVIRNNIVLNSSNTGITAAPHAANRQLRNVSIVNNTIVGHPKCMDLRWEGAENMILANNAIYCPDGIAISAFGLSGPGITVRANVVDGIISRLSTDGVKFISGGRLSNAFGNSDPFDVWPRARSVLIGKGDPKFAPRNDFNKTSRNSATVDVGAYETKNSATNPGWKIIPGFKQMDIKRE